MTTLARPLVPDPASPVRARETEILAAIRHVFAEKGFDGASMQDLARAAGMSVGNFYRYFPSKDAMVEAIIRRDLEEVEAQFALVVSAPQPLDVLRAALHARIHGESCDSDDAPMWAEMTAAGMRKPEIGALVARMEAEITAYLTQVFALATGLAPDEARARFDAHARLLVLLVKSNAMRPPVCGSDALTSMILRQVDSVLDEIAAARRTDTAAAPLWEAV